MKNGVEGIKNRPKSDNLLEKHTEQKKEKRVKMKEDSLYELWDNFKTSIQVMLIQQR